MCPDRRFARRITIRIFGRRFFNRRLVRFVGRFFNRRIRRWRRTISRLTGLFNRRLAGPLRRFFDRRFIL
jgi:hypothetical protein